MRSVLRRSSVSYWWTSSSKKYKPEKALTSRKRRNYAMVKLTILCKTTSNRMASKFLTRKASPQEPINKKSGMFIYWRASEASETVLGVDNAKSGICYMYICMWDGTCAL